MSNEYRTTIEYWKDDDGLWTATEPANESDTHGQGETPGEAVIHYIQKVYS